MKRVIYLCLFLLAWLPVFASDADDEDDYSVGYAVLHSANDFSSFFHPDLHDMISDQTRSLNKLELSSRWFGIAADYHFIMQDFIPEDDTEPNTLQSYAFGAGMPDPENLRIFAKYHVFQLNLAGVKQENKGYSVEIAKRFRRYPYIAELKGRYFRRDEARNNDAIYLDYIDNNAYNPYQNLRLEGYLSKRFDLKLGPSSDSGIAPADASPYLLVKHSAAGIFGSFNQISPYKGSKDYITTKIQVPLNASRWLGMDLRHEYQYRKDDVSEHQLGLCLRPTLFIAGPLRFTFLLEPEMQINELADVAETYTVAGGAVMSLVLKNYSNLWLQVKSRYSWYPEDDLFDTEFINYRFSSGLNIRF